MTNTLKCISPIDGSVFAERDVMDPAAALEAVKKVRAAQKSWAARPLSERIAMVKAGVARLNEMADEVTVELAHIMGRPTRHGGEFGGVNDRTEYMTSIAERALAPLVIEDSEQFIRKIERVPQGVVFIVAPWNYPKQGEFDRP